MYPYVVGNLHDDGINHLHESPENISRVLGELSNVTSKGKVL